jgi:hypothetical protein
MIGTDRTIHGYGYDGDTNNDDRHRPAPVLTTEDARQGEVSGHMRRVLAFSLMLALIAGAILIVTGM